MLKTHLPYLFLLLGVFLLFVVLLPKALDTVGQDHLLAFYSQAVEQAGALALAPPEENAWYSGAGPGWLYRQLPGLPFRLYRPADPLWRYQHPAGNGSPIPA